MELLVTKERIMRLFVLNHSAFRIVIFGVSLFASAFCFAAHIGGVSDPHPNAGYGGWNHPDYNYHNNVDNYHPGAPVYVAPTYVAPGIIINDSDDGYNCQSIQQCDSNGNCIQTQNCN